MINTISFKSSLGWITVSEENNKIISILFKKKKNINTSDNLLELKNRINKYFKKKTKILKCNFLLKGSKLQIKIWNELLKIPYGSKISYGAIAKKINTSPRYVGNVCGQNKLLLLVPCHRVVRKNGELGGFSAQGGIKLKKKLIDLESQY